MNTGKIYALLVPIVSVLIALLIASIIIIMIGKNPVTAYAIMLDGAFGSQEAIADTIMKMTPLILTGLAVGFGFRAGVFNIGAEGQMTMGALIGAVVAMNIGGIPSVIAILFLFSRECLQELFGLQLPDFSKPSPVPRSNLNDYAELDCF